MDTPRPSHRTREGYVCPNAARTGLPRLFPSPSLGLDGGEGKEGRRGGRPSPSQNEVGSCTGAPGLPRGVSNHRCDDDNDEGNGDTAARVASKSKTASNNPASPSPISLIDSRAPPPLYATRTNPKELNLAGLVSHSREGNSDSRSEPAVYVGGGGKYQSLLGCRAGEPTRHTWKESTEEMERAPFILYHDNGEVVKDVSNAGAAPNSEVAFIGLESIAGRDFGKAGRIRIEKNHAREEGNENQYSEGNWFHEQDYMGSDGRPSPSTLTRHTSPGGYQSASFAEGRAAGASGSSSGIPSIIAAGSSPRYSARIVTKAHKGISSNETHGSSSTAINDSSGTTLVDLQDVRGGGSFLDFGFDETPQDSWDQSVQESGRLHSTSYHEAETGEGFPRTYPENVFSELLDAYGNSEIARRRRLGVEGEENEHSIYPHCGEGRSTRHEEDKIGRDIVGLSFEAPSPRASHNDYIKRSGAITKEESEQTSPSCTSDNNRPSTLSSGASPRFSARIDTRAYVLAGTGNPVSASNDSSNTDSQVTNQVPHEKRGGGECFPGVDSDQLPEEQQNLSAEKRGQTCSISFLEDKMADSSFLGFGPDHFTMEQWNPPAEVRGRVRSVSFHEGEQQWNPPIGVGGRPRSIPSHELEMSGDMFSIWSTDDSVEVKTRSGSFRAEGGFEIAEVNGKTEDGESGRSRSYQEPLGERPYNEGNGAGSCRPSPTRVDRNLEANNDVVMRMVDESEKISPEVNKDKMLPDIHSAAPPPLHTRIDTSFFSSQAIKDDTSDSNSSNKNANNNSTTPADVGDGTFLRFGFCEPIKTPSDAQVEERGRARFASSHKEKLNGNLYSDSILNVASAKKFCLTSELPTADGNLGVVGAAQEGVREEGKDSINQCGRRSRFQGKQDDAIQGLTPSSISSQCDRSNNRSFVDCLMATGGNIETDKKLMRAKASLPYKAMIDSRVFDMAGPGIYSTGEAMGMATEVSTYADNEDGDYFLGFGVGKPPGTMRGQPVGRNSRSPSSYKNEGFRGLFSSDSIERFSWGEHGLEKEVRKDEDGRDLDGGEKRYFRKRDEVASGALGFSPATIPLSVNQCKYEKKRQVYAEVPRERGDVSRTNVSPRLGTQGPGDSVTVPGTKTNTEYPPSPAFLTGGGNDNTRNNSARRIGDGNAADGTVDRPSDGPPSKSSEIGDLAQSPLGQSTNWSRQTPFGSYKEIETSGDLTGYDPADDCTGHTTELDPQFEACRGFGVVKSKEFDQNNLREESGIYPGDREDRPPRERNEAGDRRSELPSTNQEGHNISSRSSKAPEAVEGESEGESEGRDEGGDEGNSNESSDNSNPCLIS